MRRDLALAFLFILLSAISGLAQSGLGMPSGADVSVFVKFDDDRPVPEMYRVQLLSTSGVAMMELLTDQQGQVVFHDIKTGPYHLSVSGPDAITTEISFAIYRGENVHTEYVRLARKENKQSVSTNGTVSRAALDIPDKAKKEFEKGLEAFEKEDFPNAKDRFHKAINIYPQYSLAYVNLGIIAMKENKIDEGELDFHQAITADPQDPAAYIHLARSQILKKQYASAEPLLQKATAISPLDPDALTMLAASELYLGKTEEAVACAKKVHSVPHDHFAVSHLVAAQGLIKENQMQAAADELRLFLKEAPDDSRAPAARATLQSIENRK